MRQNLYLIHSYLKEEGYNFNKRRIKLFLVSDLSEGILPITNTFNYLNVENIALMTEKSNFGKLPDLFLCQVTKENNKLDLALVDKANSSHIKVTFSNGRSIVVNKDEFLSHWTGLVIVIEKNNQPKKSKIKKGYFIKYSLLLSIALLIAYSAIKQSVLYQSFYLVLSIFGLFFSYLVVKEKYSSDDTASKFCSITKETDCKKVLNSKQSQIFNFFDLSDISIVYFLSVTLLFFINPHNLLQIIIASSSLPFVIYSIYSQKFEIKKWCPLCLSIGLILILQFFNLFIIYDSLKFSYPNLLFFGSILSITSIGWYHFKRLLVLKSENEFLSIESLTFRRNHKLFLPYYSSAKIVDIKPDVFQYISFGNKNAPIKLLVITNPTCDLCFQAHDFFMNLLDKYKYQIQVDFLFSVPAEERQNPATIVAEKLLELKTTSPKDFDEAFSHWYSRVKFKNWNNKWKISLSNKMNLVLKEHRKWLYENNIDYTPAVLINGKLFPNFYRVEDLVYFIDDLIEFHLSN